MATTNGEYWATRAVQREQESFLRGSALSELLFQFYEQASRELKQSISAFYGKYATQHGMNYEEAIRLLSRREMQEWRATLGEYVKQINTAPTTGAQATMIAQLDALSANSQISRLEALLGETHAQMNLLYDRCLSEMRSEFGTVYVQGYYKKHFDLQSRAGFSGEIAKLTPNMIHDAVSYPWSGSMFSDRLWQNKSALIYHMRETLTQSLIQGKSLPETTTALAGKLEQSYKVTERLVRTETNRLHNQADLDAYKAAAIEEYEFVATLDARTCGRCGELDGTHFPVKDALAGTNFPPMHPNDRCTTIEYDPDDAADWAASGEKMPTRMSYKEWSKQQMSNTKVESSSVRDTILRSSHSAPTDGYTTLTKVEKIDFADNNLKMKRIEEFASDFSHAPIEHALVISPNHHVYEFSGTAGAVNPAIGGTNILKGGIGIHNHPVNNSELMGDSFSRDDIMFSAKHKTVMEYLVSGTRRNAFPYSGTLSVEELAVAYRTAEQSVLERAFYGDLDLDIAWRQEEIMKKLAQELNGFEFFETF